MEIKSLGLAEQLRMMRGVDTITPIAPRSTSPAESGAKPSFGDFLKQQFQEANSLGLESDRAIERSLAGQETNPHNTIIALQKADISFKLMLNVSQRLIQAYQEVVRMQIG